MFVVLGPTVFWVQCICLIAVLTLLVHVKPVLLVVDFGRIGENAFCETYFQL